MERYRVINDQVQRTVKEVNRAIDGMGRPEYDYKLCVELATEGMQELVKLNNEFQSHLNAGTLSEKIEVYTETIWHLPTHDLIQYWRLLPESHNPEHLFPGCRGAFDFKDAARDREMDWPEAVFISPTLFLEGIAEEYRAAFQEHLDQQAQAAARQEQEYEDTRKYMEHYYEGGD